MDYLPIWLLKDVTAMRGSGSADAIDREVTTGRPDSRWQILFSHWW